MANIGIFLGDIQGNGGISRVTWIIANKLCKYYSLSILSSFHSKENRYKYADDISVEFLFEEQKPVHTRFIQLTNGIRNFVKKKNLDVLICAGAIYYPPCALAVKGTRTKFVCWEHSNVSIEHEHKFQGICRKIGAKNADLIIPLTKTDERLYRKKFHVRNCHAIYNPVDDRLLGDAVYNADSKKIISVGRLCPQKDFETLVDVADIFFKRFPDWTWDIFGEGENRQSIQNKINEKGIGQKLKLRGRVDDLYDRYGQYSILVMTSRFEGFPMTLLESTAKGIPAVAFDVLTGPNEIIEDGKTGFLVKPLDINGMAEKIEQLAGDKSARIRMSNSCLNIRNKFSCESIVQDWEKNLETLIES